MASLLEPQPPLDPTQEVVQWARDSTLSAAGLNVVGGYVMGFAFSLFGAMISAETATQCMGTADFFRHSLRAAGRLGYQFAFFGFIFGGIEVALEKRRGRKDMWNATAAGGLIGGYYGWRSYRRPGLIAGTVGGLALSMVFERLMDMLGFAQK